MHWLAWIRCCTRQAVRQPSVLVGRKDGYGMVGWFRILTATTMTVHIRLYSNLPYSHKGLMGYVE